MMKMPAVEKLIDVPLAAGESPVWDHVATCLWFIDITAPALFRFDPHDGALARFDMPASIGSVGLAPAGRLVVALRTGVHLFDPADGTLEFLCHPEPDRPANRLNDGKVGPDGAFWIGSVYEKMAAEPAGALYRVSPAGEVRTIREGVHASNGLAWSPDGRTMYHADSMVHEIRAYDLDPASGEASRPRQLIALDPEWGNPDGAAVDAEGFYWSAGISAGRLNRISAEGELVESVRLPIGWPSMPCFGGPDMRTVYVTSLGRKTNGVANVGSLYSFRTDVPGLPSDVFGVARS
jgi:sugar lactone lactonase YvrE